MRMQVADRRGVSGSGSDRVVMSGMINQGQCLAAHVRDFFQTARIGDPR
jgi:hypothetical protein